MKKVFLSLAAIAITGSLMAAVTPHYGVELGYDHGQARLRADNARTYSWILDYAKMDGFHIGGNVQLDFLEGQHKPGLVLGLNYQFLANNLANTDPTIKQGLNNFKETMKALGATNIQASDYAFMHTLQIPVRFQYTYQINNDWRFFALTGPQIRLHMAFTENEKTTYKLDGKKNGEYDVTDYVAGKYKETTWINGDKTENSGTLSKFERLDCFDMSWGFGVGFGWKALSFNINYDLGMINLFNKEIKTLLNSNYVLNSDALALTIGYRIK